MPRAGASRGCVAPRASPVAAAFEVITSPIEEVTAVGVRTADGVHHDADAIVYGTGFAVRAGLPHDTLVGARGVSIHQAWVDGAEPYLGVALHGFPNYFTVSGPDFGAAMRYVVECLQLMGRHSRIEVRRSAQRVFNERVHLRQPAAPPGRLGVRHLVVRRRRRGDVRRSGNPDRPPIPAHRCGCCWPVISNPSTVNTIGKEPFSIAYRWSWCGPEP